MVKPKAKVRHSPAAKFSQLSVRVPFKTAQALKQDANDIGVSLADMVRFCIREYFNFRNGKERAVLNVMDRHGKADSRKLRPAAKRR